MNRRPWYQFSLRMSLIGMLLAAIVLAWFRSIVSCRRSEQRAIAHLESVDAFVVTESILPQWLDWMPSYESFERVTWICFEDHNGIRHSERNLSDEYVARFHDSFPVIETFRYLKAIDLSASLVNDEDLGCLAKLPRLRELDVSHTNVTDVGIAKLKNTQLQTLSLSSTCITNACIENLPLSQLCEILYR